MTRTVLLISIFLSANLIVFAQETFLNSILSIPPLRVERIQPKQEAQNIIISSKFSADDLQQSVAQKSGELQTVYYIYTSYRKSSTFDQSKLNAQRIERLTQLIPEVLENRFVAWKFIEQTGCTSAEMGKDFFHGFVLEYRLEPTETLREKEIQNLQSFWENPELGYAFEEDPSASELSKELTLVQMEEKETPSGLKNQEAQYPEGNFALYQFFKKHIPGGGKIALNREDLWVKFDMELDENGKITDLVFKEEVSNHVKDVVRTTMDEMPDWDPALKKGAPEASTVHLELRLSYSPIVRGMYYRDGKKPDFNATEISAAQGVKEAPDEKAMDRRKKAETSAVYRAMDAVIPNEKVAVVMDVTSSMSTHLASMNWWVEKSPDSLNIVHYTFFNDGNNTEDRKKKAGKTGGIYHGQKLKDLPATLLAAMRNGNGGDVIENDFEALLAAQSQPHNAEAMLLIVDNFSDVRDEKLLPQIHTKTHVLISGDVTVVRECYLNLAKATGGDILVNGKRIGLNNVSAGERIVIANSTYTYDGEKFKLL